MAFNFNAASTQYLSASNPISSAPLTFACWARATSFSVNHALVALNETAGVNRILLYVTGSGLVSFFVSDSGGFGQAQASGVVSLNQWFHACGVASSSTSRSAFRDGANKITSTVSRTPTSINALTIGAERTSGTTTNLFSGLLAEVAVWNAALTDEEVASLAKGFTPDQIRPQSLVFYAPLARDLIDAKGGLTITNNNAATVGDHPRVYT